MTLYLLSSFSINMLDPKYKYTIEVESMTTEQAQSTLQIVNSDVFKARISHRSTAKVLSKKLGLNLACNRKNVTLEDNDVAIMAQLPRPKEGQLYTESEIKSIDINYYWINISTT